MTGFDTYCVSTPAEEHLKRRFYKQKNYALESRSRIWRKGLGMRKNRIRVKWESGKPVICGWLSSNSAYTAELAGHAGFDCVNIDLQHGMTGFESAQLMLHALSATPATPIVRVPSVEATLMMKVLDAGSYGIICPMVEDKETAKTFVAATRYPPLGNRSFGPARGLLYGGPDYFKDADETIVRLAMIETAEGLEQIDAVSSVQGLDGVFIGPNDLALSLGYDPSPDPTEPPVVEAIKDILQSAKSHGRHAGIFCPSGVVAQRRIEEGFDFVVPNSDVNLLKKTMKEEIAAIGEW
jgi:4-hydroxy-2-oxoheptanedioate aldolase